jgi:predicted NBD/HSP70 family sugar kinase
MTQRSDHPFPVTIGIDVGDRFSQLCVLDEAGETIEEARLAGPLPRMRVGARRTRPARRRRDRRQGPQPPSVGEVET